jgi:HEAT repeat protein
LFVALLGHVLDGASPGVVAAAPNPTVIRAAIQPPAGQLTTEQTRQPKVVAIHCLATLVHERLISLPGLLLVDPQRFAAIRDELTSPALAKPGRLTLAGFAARLPVDLLVQIEPADDGILVEATATGDAAPERIVVPYADARDFKNLLAATGPLVARRLGLGPDDAARLAWLDLLPDSKVSGEAVVAALLTRSTRVEWGDVGLAKMAGLAAHLDAARSSPILARALLEAGLELGRGNMGQPVNDAVQRLKLVVPFALGTAAEPAAIAFVRDTKHDRGGFESDLVALLGEFRKKTDDSVDAAIEDALEGGGDTGDPGLIRDTSMAGAAADGSSVPRQCGGLRALAAMQSKQAPALLALAARATDPRLRQAAAEGFGELAAPAGDAELVALAADKEPNVAVAALKTLASRGRAPQALLQRVRARLKTHPEDRTAAELLCRHGTDDDLPTILATSVAADPRLRLEAWRGVMRLAAITDGGAAWLADPDRLVAAAAVESLPDVDEKRLALLANDADWTLAEAARLRLGNLLPAEPRLRRQRQLVVEHPYVRGRIVAALAADTSAEAIADLATACDNADHVVRADALAALAAVAPAQARDRLATGLADRYRLVRLQAAAAASRCAESADAAMLQEAIRDETDEATRLHLAAALARATGAAAPPPPSAAHQLGRDRNEVFLCGHGPGAATSPFRGYYDLAAQGDTALRAAHAAGKVVLARVRTAPNPAKVALSREWRDIFWLPFDQELLPALDCLDGVVIGEETMYFRPFQTWNEGWRIFCLEAGIDPLRIAGKQENLSARQKQAWWTWEQRVAIEGFNRIHDFVKLRYGQLRPGFQTATFMPDQNGPCPFDREWKFDISAAYYYDAPNRQRYAQIRRLKTVWPDRPALWLSYGIVNAASTSGGVKHDYRLPMRPQHAISSHAYADSVATWLAGGHTGFFQSMLFMDPKMRPGPMAAGTWVTLEDLYAGSPSLEKGLDTVFRGLAKTYSLQSAAAAGATPKLDLADGPDLDDVSLDDKPAEDPAVERVTRERAALRRALLLERRMIDDVARLLAGLPFPANAKPALLVGDPTATRGVFRLPGEFDALDGIDKLTAQPLDGYRFIAVAANEQAAYRDGAIDAVVAWLTKQPGVLCVEGWLSTDGAMPLATPEAIDVPFKSRWPWQDDIARSADGKITVATSPRVRVIAGTAENPEAVVWRGDGMRGAVLFDFDGKQAGGTNAAGKKGGSKSADRTATAAIVQELARLASAPEPADRIGMAFTEPAGLVTGRAAGLTGFAASKPVASTRVVQGMDLLTGRVDPVLEAARAAAIVGDSYRGEFVAVEQGVCVLGDAPLEAVEKVDGGLTVRCRGLLRAVSPRGVAAAWSGSAPPEIATAPGDDATFLAWLLESEAPGVATLPQPEGPPVTLIRTNATVTLRPAPPAPRPSGAGP